MKNLTPPARSAKPSALPQEANPNGALGQATGLGLYVHFPWCLRKCPYCDFLSIASDRADIPRDAYTQSVLRELESRAPSLAGEPLRSIFFGGGTPSLWGADGIGAVIAAARRLFQWDQTEISVECNPTSFSRELGERLHGIGVDRVSIGVQSLSDATLEFLGRLHDGAGGLRAVEQALEAGLSRVSADLIFGVHGQRPEEAATEADTLARLGLSHVSAYALTIEPGTQFGARHRQGRLPLLPEESVAECFLAVEGALHSHSLCHYEISNYAKPGHEARHNLGYWQGRNYLGIGCGAWGTIPRGEQVIRYKNPVSIERYLETTHWPTASAGTAGPGQTYAAFETLDAETRLLERLMLGLRVESGLDIPAHLAELGLGGLGARREQRLERLAAQGKITWDGRWLRIPKNQWLFADAIIAQLA